MNDKELTTVRITVSDGFQERINLTLPAGLIRIADEAGFEQMILSASDSLKNLNFKDIITQVNEGTTGVIISYLTDENEMVTVEVK